MHAASRRQASTTRSRTPCPSTSRRCKEQTETRVDQTKRGRAAPAHPRDPVLGPPRERAQGAGARRQAAARLNSGRARQRADELEARLKRRLTELDQERQLSPLPPVVVGGALVIPRGLLERLRGERSIEPDVHARETERVERLAVDAVLAAEADLGRHPEEMATQQPGLRHPVSRRSATAARSSSSRSRAASPERTTFTITKNEILHLAQQARPLRPRARPGRRRRCDGRALRPQAVQGRRGDSTST